MTQFAVVRLLSNPAFSPDALPLEQAVAVLKRNLEHPLHEFWPDSAAVTGLLEELVQHTQDYRQIMDVYLLGLAVRKNARLATFDPNVRQLAINAGKETHVELLSIG
jgi:predicted nucleic acid-binding protein